MAKITRTNPSNISKPAASYSHVVTAEAATKFVFCAGQLPRDPDTGKVVSEDIGEQTARVLTSLRAVLEGAGSSLEQVVKTTVFMTDLSEFAAMNETYASLPTQANRSTRTPRWSRCSTWSGDSTRSTSTSRGLPASTTTPRTTGSPSPGSFTSSLVSNDRRNGVPRRQ